MLLPAQTIQKKRDGNALTEEEIRFFINGFTSGELPEYQMSAMAMAVCFQGMNFDEQWSHGGGGAMLLMAGVAKNVADARQMLQKKLASGEALRNSPR